MERYLEIDFMLGYLLSTPDKSNLQGKPTKFRFIGSSKEIARGRRKTGVYCTMNIFVTFNSRNVK